MNLLIFSKTRLFAESLAESLSHHPTVASAAGQTDLETAAETLALGRVDAVVVDLASDGWEAAARLAAQPGDPVVMGFAVADTPADFLRSARSGCNGVIPHDASVDRAVALIRQALCHELTYPPGHVAELMRALRQAVPTPAPAMPPCLTRREGEICGLVCEGLTNKEIARELSCSEGTVKNHVHAILTKLDVPRRSALQASIRSM
jgi:two-component system nitrate/nitrite response regulator NarL